MLNLSLQHRFELITSPDVLPISVGFAKKHMRVEHSDDDALVARLINIAVNFVDMRGALHKGMINQTWEHLTPRSFTALWGQYRACQ